MHSLNQNRFGFFGTYKCDIINYFSRILNNLDKKVVVVDASIEQTMNYCIPDTYEDDYISYRNVDYYKNCINQDRFSDISYEDYDVILIDFGFNKQLLNELYDCKALFLVCDFQRHNVQNMKDFISSLEGESSIVRIYRDIVDSKINSKYVDSYLDIESCTQIIANYDFELEQCDYKCNLESQYNDIFKFKDLSKEYKDMFYDIISEFFQVEKKQILKAIKLAERGK